MVTILSVLLEKIFRCFKIKTNFKRRNLCCEKSSKLASKFKYRKNNTNKTQTMSLAVTLKLGSTEIGDRSIASNIKTNEAKREL